MKKAKPIKSLTREGGRARAATMQWWIFVTLLRCKLQAFHHWMPTRSPARPSLWTVAKYGIINYGKNVLQWREDVFIVRDIKYEQNCNSSLPILLLSSHPHQTEVIVIYIANIEMNKIMREICVAKSYHKVPRTWKIRESSKWKLRRE